MAHRLAERLGRADVDAMLAEMSAQQFEKWLAYMALEPRAEDMLPWLFASVCRAIWNVQIAKGTKKGEEPKLRELHDFVLLFGDMPDPREAAAAKAIERRVPAAETFSRVVDTFEALGMKAVKDHRPAPDPEVVKRALEKPKKKTKD